MQFMRDEKGCDIVGLTGIRHPITETVILSFCLSNFKVQSFKFAVVPDTTFSNCFLLGLDFLNQHDVSIDFNKQVCKLDILCMRSLKPLEINLSRSTALRVTRQSSHTLKVNIIALIM